MNMAARLAIATDAFCEEQRDRFLPWTFKEPVVLDGGRLEQIRSVQAAMSALIEGLGANFGDVADHLHLDSRVRSFLKSLDDLKFKLGTYRTDFIIDEMSQMSLIEVTCRFPMNGYFLSQAVNRLPDLEGFTKRTGVNIMDFRSSVSEYFARWLEGSDHVCMIHGPEDRGHESLVLAGICRKAGLDVHRISLERWVEDWPALVRNAAIIAELTFEEWLSLPSEIVQAMLSRPILNDPRHVFLVHDKAFFAFAFDDALVKPILSDAQVATLRASFAPTYLPWSRPDVWSDAARSKDGWVLKPRSLGKSLDIIAGSLIDADAWKDALRQAEEKNMILQRWSQSTRVHGQTPGGQHDDYICGTLLYWGNDFLGPGMVRASSWPVTNVVDDRKIACVVTREADRVNHPGSFWL